MNKIKKVLKENKLYLDLLNVLLGMIVLILVVLVIIYPANRLILMFVCIIGGFMNVVNGIRLYQNRDKRTMAAGLFILGVIIMILGVML